MKLLLAGDWHGSVDQARWVLDLAIRCRVNRVFQLGDFGAWEHTPAGVVYLDRLNELYETAGVTLYWLDGNHDKWSLVMERYGENRDGEGFVIQRPAIRYSPRGHRFTWDRVTFLTMGGAYSVDKQWRLEREQVERRRRLDNHHRNGATFIDSAETLWFPEEELTEAQVTTAVINADPVDILLTHDKPLASNPRWNRKDLLECLPNQTLIQYIVARLVPKLVVHGHLHYRYEDKIYVGDELHATVIGLDADPEAAEFPGYSRYDNVLSLNLDSETGWFSYERITPP